jgi:hypothetical protein
MILALAVGACAPSQARTDVAALPACGAGDQDTGAGYHARECKLEADGQTFDVKYAEMPEGADGGNVSVDVLGADGGVMQTLEETNVSEYLAPGAQDLDADGHIDVLIPRESGNVNTNYGVWRFDPQTRRYARLGEMSGVEFMRTSDGYLASSARSSAAAWVVSFYRFDPNALTPLVSVNVEAQGVNDAGQATGVTCTIEEAPGLAALHMTEDAARTKFCAEPAAARVFAP